MTITIKEKEHWKKRITRKIDQAIEVILATEDPNFMEKINCKAKTKTWESLGIAKLIREVKELDAQKKDLENKRITAFRRMLAVVRGVSMEDVDKAEVRYSQPHEVDSAIHRRKKLIEKELLAENKLGCQILRLRLEKEELLDTVWLASSPKQIKELWSTVASVLDQKPTELQKEALSMEPMEGSKEVGR
jgi:hypothetical protein